MLKKIAIWLLPLLALIGGSAAGGFLAPKPETGAAETAGEDHATEAGNHGMAATQAAADGHGTGAHGGGDRGSGDDKNPAAWFTFPSQFFIPLVRRGEIEGMIVLTLTIETTEADLPEVENQQHRLRDALLRSLIIHANSGGFSGNYTAEAKLERLRTSLHTAAVKASGPKVRAVLIEDIGQAGR